jgi:hypothetical protein
MIPRQLANKLPEKRFHWPAKMRVILLERTNSRRRAVRRACSLAGENLSVSNLKMTHTVLNFFLKKQGSGNAKRAFKVGLFIGGLEIGYPRPIQK